MPRTPRTPGFTLLELLVALAILALSLTAVMRVFGDGLRGGALAADYLEATARAQSDLARLGIETFVPLAAGIHAGRYDDRFAWRIEIAPLAAAPAAGERHDGLFTVIFSVSWQDHDKERTVTLETIRR